MAVRRRAGRAAGRIGALPVQAGDPRITASARDMPALRPRKNPPHPSPPPSGTHAPLAFSTKGLAPARSRASTMASCFLDTASCSAVLPSRCGHTCCTSAPAVRSCAMGGPRGRRARPIDGQHPVRVQLPNSKRQRRCVQSRPEERGVRLVRPRHAPLQLLGGILAVWLGPGGWLRPGRRNPSIGPCCARNPGPCFEYRSKCPVQGFGEGAASLPGLAGQDGVAQEALATPLPSPPAVWPKHPQSHRHAKDLPVTGGDHFAWNSLQSVFRRTVNCPCERNDLDQIAGHLKGCKGWIQASESRRASPVRLLQHEISYKGAAAQRQAPETSWLASASRKLVAFLGPWANQRGTLLGRFHPRTSHRSLATTHATPA